MVHSRAGLALQPNINCIKRSDLLRQSFKKTTYSHRSMHPIKEEVGKKLVIQTADRTVQIKADINNYYKTIGQYKIITFSVGAPKIVTSLTI